MHLDVNLLTMLMSALVVFLTQFLKEHPGIRFLSAEAIRPVQAFVILLSMAMGVLDALANDPGRLAQMPWGDMMQTVATQGAIIWASATVMYQGLKGWMKT